MADVISLDLHRAIKRTGMTHRQFAEAIRLSPETLKGILYRDRLTSLESAYEMAVVAGELRIVGPKGTVALVHTKDDRTPPPAAPMAAKPHSRREAA